MTPRQRPGEQLWTEVLAPLNLTVGEIAAALNVTRKTVSMLINGKQDISAEMSVRVARATGGAPDEWARRQLAFDLATVNGATLGVTRLVRR